MNAKTITSLNPATLETVGEVKITPPESVAAVVAETRQAQSGWAALSLKNRTALLRRAQQIMLGQADALAALICAETGRPYTEALSLEVQSAIDLLAYYADHAHRFLSDHRVPLHHPFFWRRESRRVYQPLGVLGIIAPWNWPLLIPLGGIVPALLSGNGVVFKPSELTPLVAESIRSIFIEAGLPEALLQTVHGHADTGTALVQSPVDKIFFTGSTRVGHAIYKQAAADLKKCVLEMGGSDPAIVCEDADLNTAAAGIAWGAFTNAGQNCNSIERLFVHQSVSNAFIDKLLDHVRHLRLGHGMAADTDIGPLASQAQLNKIRDGVSKEIKNGGCLLCGGEGVQDKAGYFFQPTVILRDKARYSEKDDELFGPVLWVTEVESDDEAVALANRSAFGLASSVWTGDRRRGHAIARRLEAGTCMINDCIVSFGLTEAGWTGLKNSGIGWVHGEKGLDEMVNIKYINRDTQPHRQNFWWFPYDEAMVQAIKNAMPFLFSSKWADKLKSLPRLMADFAGDMLLNTPKKGKD